MAGREALATAAGEVRPPQDDKTGERMDHAIQYRPMRPGDVERVSAFISEVFHRCVAPEFSREGIAAFMRFIEPAALGRRLATNLFAIVATRGGEVIGVIAVRDHRHVALFFVSPRHQRRGIGSALLTEAISVCIRHRRPGGLGALTVNASPNATGAYQRLGFEATDIEQCSDGIRHIPMVLHLRHPAVNPGN